MTFILIFLLLMALSAIVPLLLRRFHVPAVVSMMLVGMVIGPNAFDLIRKLNGFLGRGYPTEQIYVVIDALGLLGLVLLMAMAGMEVDIRLLRAERRAVGWLSLLTFFIPAVTGYLVYAWFEPDDLIGKLVYASLFASHSVGIVFPVIRELKVARTRFGVAVLASTVVTDVASLVLLAVCVQLKRHQVPTLIGGSISIFDHLDLAVLGNWFPLLFVAVIALFVLVSLHVTSAVAARVLGRLAPEDDRRLTFFLAGVLVIVFLGELIGVNVIVGAFIAGMAIVRVPEFHAGRGILHRKIEGVGYGLVVPFLFLSIGMKTDMRIVVAAWENAAIALATVIGLVASKILSGWFAMRLSGFGNVKGLCAGLMTIPQLSATIAAAAVALQLRMLGVEFFNAIVFLSVVTTIPVPTLVKLLIVKSGVTFDQAEDALAGGMDEVDSEIEEDLI